MSETNLCQLLEWDSNFFGLKIARALPYRLDPLTLQAITDWCLTHHIECLYFLADSDDSDTVRLAQMGGFDLVDVRVTLEHHVESDPPNVDGQNQFQIRPCELDDIPVLKRIARTGFHASRFYFDPHFPPERCDALYETWAEKSCQGYADIVLVAEQEGTVVGFITGDLAHDQGEIGLVGISPEARGKGLGKLLVRAALTRFVAHRIQQVSVVTQGRNIVAQRLYQRCGFVTRQVQLWYHWWPNSAP